jgi:peptidylprolyl isomerase
MWMVGCLVVLVAAATLSFCGCGGNTSSTSASSTAAVQTGSPREAANRPEPKVPVPQGDPPKQLEVEELIEGTGPAARKGDVVSVNYVGAVFEGGEVFESSFETEPITFELGSGQVISGWEQGVEGMKVGGRRELVIPPAMAYGPQAVGPIPANSTLVFVVDLVSAE